MLKASLAPALALALVVALPAAPARAQERALTVDLGGGVRVDLVLIPAGSFQQGSPPGEIGRSDDEALRKVTLSRGFYIGKYPVTRGQYARFAAETGFRTESEKGTSGGFGFDGKALAQRPDFNWRSPGFPQTDDHPVTLVTYDDALAFTNWVTQKAGRVVTLPTEAQWEYANRAGTQTRYYAGEGDDKAQAIGWFKGNAGNGTRPVGQKQPNAFGLFDMSGDVWEWCRDWYSTYAPGPITDPEQSTPPSGDTPRRVLRGGSWLKDAKNLRAAARYRNTPGSRNADNGFRVVAALEKSAALPPAPTPTTGQRSGSSTPPPPPTTGKSSGGGAFAAVCMLGVIFGVFGLIVFAVLRGQEKNRRGARGFAQPQGGLVTNHGITVAPAADGFWLSPAPHLRGARVHYTYVAGGRLLRNHAIVDGGPKGQFVYTGAPPTNVQIVMVEPAANRSAPARGGGGGGGFWSSQPSRVVHHHHHHHHTSDHSSNDSSSFGGFPSAY